MTLGLLGILAFMLLVYKYSEQLDKERVHELELAKIEVKSCEGNCKC